LTGWGVCASVKTEAGAGAKVTLLGESVMNLVEKLRTLLVPVMLVFIPAAPLWAAHTGLSIVAEEEMHLAALEEQGRPTINKRDQEQVVFVAPHLRERVRANPVFETWFFEGVISPDDPEISLVPLDIYQEVFEREVVGSETYEILNVVVKKLPGGKLRMKIIFVKRGVLPPFAVGPAPPGGPIANSKE